jgi:hypothetical protein
MRSVDNKVDILPSGHNDAAWYPRNQRRSIRPLGWKTQLKRRHGTVVERHDRSTCIASGWTIGRFKWASTFLRRVGDRIRAKWWHRGSTRSCHTHPTEAWQFSCDKSDMERKGEKSEGQRECTLLVAASQNPGNTTKRKDYITSGDAARGVVATKRTVIHPVSIKNHGRLRWRTIQEYGYIRAWGVSSVDHTVREENILRKTFLMVGLRNLGRRRAFSEKKGSWAFDKETTAARALDAWE